MTWCLWAIIVLGMSPLFSLDVHKHPFVFQKVVSKLFIQDHFIYPLYDVKPVAYGIYSKNEDWQNVLSSGKSSNINYYEYKVFKNYINENLSSNFLLLEEQNPYCDDLCANVYFVNKLEFIVCCNNNLKTFKEILGKSFNPEKLLKDLTLNKNSLRKSLKYNEQLLGILLGYGVQNSREFSLNKQGDITSIPFSITDFVELTFLGEEVTHLRRIIPVVFVGIPGTSETLTLQKKYAQKYRELSRLYSSPESYGKILDKLIFSEGSK